ncbi:hypothetical protein F7217_00600 [Helicobacter pylori]|nr:hypothetical protein [Helicobacter pylori]
MPLTPPPNKHKHKTLKIAFLKFPNMTLSLLLKNSDFIIIKSSTFLKPVGNSALKSYKRSKSLTGRLW